MGDGHLNKCKDCTRRDTAENTARKMQDPEWAEKEAERQRQKEKKRYYTKLKGTESFNAKRIVSRKKWGEKYPEKMKAKAAMSNIRPPKGYNNHHWSYNDEHLRDTILLQRDDHYFIHRYIKYDVESKMYKTPIGDLLDTKAKHLDYISSLLGRELKRAA